MFTFSGHKGNAKQNHNVLSHPCYNVYHEEQIATIANAGEDVEEIEPLYTLGENVNNTTTIENRLESPQTTKNRSAI
jgi:hypothetical protein